MAQTPPNQAYIKNDSGTEIGVEKAPDGFNINDNSGIQAQTEVEAGKAGALPGAERLDGEVNWPGSSFSGVDIKIVAHLYGAIDTDTELEKLTSEQALDTQIASACDSALGALNPISALNYLNFEGEQAFINSTGLSDSSEESQKAANILRSIFRNTPRGSVTAFENILRLNLQSRSDLYRSLAESLEDRIKIREDIRKKSTSTITLATLQTLSLQTHREKYAVRSLGSSYAKGYTRGPRTLAGSMIFTMFNEHALARLIRAMSGKGSVYGERDNELSSLIVDQLPPIDLTVVIANEYGQLSQMGIYGVEFVNDGMTMSVEDIITEEVCQFIARDCDVLTSRGNIRLSRLQRGMHFNDEGSQDTSATSLLIGSSDDYNRYLDKLKVRRRLLNR